MTRVPLRQRMARMLEERAEAAERTLRRAEPGSPQWFAALDVAGRFGLGRPKPERPHLWPDISA